MWAALRNHSKQRNLGGGLSQLHHLKLFVDTDEQSSGEDRIFLEQVEFSSLISSITESTID